MEVTEYCYCGMEMKDHTIWGSCTSPRVMENKMRKAIVTVDLGFGDGGKGATVDWLCRTNPVDLVIRYSGGPQCGHNVVTPEGQHHCFAQFGSGSFSNIPTFLDRNVIIDPLAMKREEDHLISLGLKPSLCVHNKCLVATPFHKIVNQEKENSRGSDRHGSCGMGVGETRAYWLKYGSDAIFAEDLYDRYVLEDKLSLMRQRFLLEKYSGLIYRLQPKEIANQLRSYDLRICKQIPEHDFAVFEAAQGVLLDENFGFQPHTTWSTVTDFHADVSKYDEVEKIGIIRAYHTRHGAGPLPSFNQGLTDSINHIHNPRNLWQGSFRCGWFDTALFKYALNVNPVDSVAVTCLDQLPSDNFVTNDYLEDCRTNAEITERIKFSEPETKLKNINPLDIISQNIKIHSVSYGPTWQDRKLYNEISTSE